MRKYNRIAAMLLSILALALLAPVSAFAAGSMDLTQNASMTVSYLENDTPLAGAAFDIYLVATAGETGELTVTETFERYHVNIDTDNDNRRTLASTLEGYVLRDNIAPADSGKTDAQGTLTFPTGAKRLELGLYLVMGHRHTQDGYVYETEPFIIMLPGLNEETEQWIYDVTVKPKHQGAPETGADSTVERKVLKVWKDEGYEKDRPQKVVVQLLRDGEIFDTVTLNAENNWRYTWSDLEEKYRWTVVETELQGYTVEVTREGSTFVVTNTYDKENSEDDEPETPTEPRLPQTGQLWWPVPVLIASGLLLMVIGLLRRRGTSYEE